MLARTPLLNAQARRLDHREVVLVIDNGVTPLCFVVIDGALYCATGAATWAARNVEVQGQRERLLQLHLDGHVDDATYKMKAAELRRDHDTLTCRLAEVQEVATSADAAKHRQSAVLTFCKVIRKGLDRLDGRGRQKLLRMLVDRVLIYDRRLEIHGVLPSSRAPLPTCTDSDLDGRRVRSRRLTPAENRPDRAPDVVSYRPVRFTLQAPLGNRDAR